MSDPLELVGRFLIGQPLAASHRAAEMECFGFGQVVDWQDHRGRSRSSREFGLHVQCSWRIVREGRVVVGSDDLLKPRPDWPADVKFDPNDLGVTLREDLLVRFFKEREARPRIVVACETGDAGRLRLTLDDGCVLEVFPDRAAETANEYWRVLDINGDHVVVSGTEVEIVPKRESND